ncbi:MAG: DUF4105 domain-containing protein [Sphingobacteriales bacterium]|nr:MAG: DUF4105 domain-containing protein [Sphingobacteriales bacterium]
MFKRALLFCLCFFAAFVLRAQTDSLGNSHLRISLLTCGTGDEIWETFGHTAIRVTDSMAGTDIVYNYGTFNGFDERFELNFMRGKLNYYLSFYSYSRFEEEYVEANRSIQEQVLNISDAKKREIYDFLKWNGLEENRYYKYDFFFDNCATRIRDAFPKSLGEGFKYGPTIPADSRMTFRQIINIYFYKTHWERFGINILLGSRIDKVMDNKDIMFLPDHLRDGMTTATLNGKPVTTKPVLLVPGSEHKPAGVNWPLVLTISLGILTILGLVFKPLLPLGKVMSFLLLFVTGLLGCLILVMWFATDHQGCQNNFNILWALPTNVFLSVAAKRNKGRYALVAIVLIIISVLLHLFRVQELPVPEILPILLALLFIYGTIYRQDKQVIQAS